MGRTRAWSCADPALRRVGAPAFYYYLNGPIGQVFLDILSRRPPQAVGGVGLGTGSLASYGRRGEDFTFFEIDPAIARIASDARFFTYLRDSSSRCGIVPGDARRSLRREPDRRYGLLVFDAFSGDAIPVHLLTRETIRLDLQKLADGGILAFHITNQYLDLEPVMAALAAAEGLAGYSGATTTSLPRSSVPARTAHGGSSWRAGGVTSARSRRTRVGGRCPGSVALRPGSTTTPTS